MSNDNVIAVLKALVDTYDNMAITGGGEKVNYYISGRYYQQYGMFNIDKDLYKDYSFRAKMDAKQMDQMVDKYRTG